jgi:hypothetical protein
VYTTDKGARKGIVKCGGDSIHSLNFDPQSSRLCVVGDAGLHIFDATTLKRIHWIKFDYFRGVQSPIFYNNNLIDFDRDGDANIWDLGHNATYKKIKKSLAQNRKSCSPPSNGWCSPDGVLIHNYSAPLNENTLWIAEPGDVTKTLRAIPAQGIFSHQAQFSRNNQHSAFVCPSRNGAPLSPGVPSCSLCAAAVTLHRTSSSPAGSALRMPTKEHTTKEHCSIKFSPSGTRMLTLERTARKVSLWSVHGSCLQTVNVPENTDDVQLSDDESSLLIISDDGRWSNCKQLIHYRLAPKPITTKPVATKPSTNDCTIM